VEHIHMNNALLCTSKEQRDQVESFEKEFQLSKHNIKKRSNKSCSTATINIMSQFIVMSEF
jgi:hypothetical protein